MLINHELESKEGSTLPRFEYSPDIYISLPDLHPAHKFSAPRRNNTGPGDQLGHGTAHRCQCCREHRIANIQHHGIERDGTVACWGNNNAGQTNVPPGLSNVVAISVGEDHCMVLRRDGSVVSWGGLTTPQGISNVVAIAAGGSEAGGFSLVLRKDGTVFGWAKLNYWGQIDVPEGLSNVVAIAAGSYHGLALKSDRTIVAWGLDQPNVPEELSNVVAIAAGGGHNLALKSDGTVTAWGGNGLGQSDVPEGLSNVVAVSAGEQHSLALKSDGTVVGWGYNEFGPTTIPENLTNVVAISAGIFHSVAISAPLEMNSITVTNQDRALHFHTFTGQQYSIEYSTDLSSTNWTVLPGSISEGTGQDVSVIDTNPVSTQKFYRLKQ